MEMVVTAIGMITRLRKILVYLKTAESGIYHVTSLRISDTAGNTTVYTSDDLSNLGFDTSFEISGSSLDTTAPVLTAFSITPSVDLSEGNSPLVFSATTNEDETGIDEFVVYFDKLLNSFGDTSTSANGSWSLLHLNGNGGYSDWDDYEVTQNLGLFKNSTESGIYHVTRYIRYKGNTTVYTSDDLSRV